MRFGNTLSSIRPGIVIMTILGTALGLFALVYNPSHISLSQSWRTIVSLVLIPPGVFLFACLPTCVFSIRIEEGQVKHLFFDRYVLSQYSITDFTKMEIGKRPWGAVIHFKDENKIRFLGANLGIIGKLNKTLTKAKSEANQRSDHERA